MIIHFTRFREPGPFFAGFLFFFSHYSVGCRWRELRYGFKKPARPRREALNRTGPLRNGLRFEYFMRLQFWRIGTRGGYEPSSHFFYFYFPSSCFRRNVRGIIRVTHRMKGEINVNVPLVNFWNEPVLLSDGWSRLDEMKLHPRLLFSNEVGQIDYIVSLWGVRVSFELGLR